MQVSNIGTLKVILFLVVFGANEKLFLFGSVM